VTESTALQFTRTYLWRGRLTELNIIYPHKAMNTSPPIPPWTNKVSFSEAYWTNDCREAGCYEQDGSLIEIFIDGVHYTNAANSICPSCRVSASLAVNQVEAPADYGVQDGQRYDGATGFGVYVQAPGRTEPPSGMSRRLYGTLKITVTDGVNSVSQSFGVSAVAQMVCQVDTWTGC